MNAFLQWLALFQIPVEEICRELANVTMVVVFAFVLLAGCSLLWFLVPIALYAVTTWLWWVLDRFRFNKGEGL